MRNYWSKINTFNYMLYAQSCLHINYKLPRQSVPFVKSFEGSLWSSLLIKTSFFTADSQIKRNCKNDQIRFSKNAESKDSDWFSVFEKRAALNSNEKSVEIVVNIVTTSMIYSIIFFTFSLVLTTHNGVVTITLMAPAIAPKRRSVPAVCVVIPLLRPWNE